MRERERYGPKVWLLVVALAALYLLAAATEARAETIDIPIGTERGAPGEVIPKGSIPAEPGDQCIADLTYTNNDPDFSEHPDTDILVGPIVFRDVERGPGITFDPQPFTATGPVEVSIRLGGDGITSGGFTLEVTCNPPEQPSTTTTSVMSSTTSTVPGGSTTTVVVDASTTTLSPPPSGPVEAGGGGCADGSCDHPDSPLARYGSNLLILGAFVLIGALVLAAIGAHTKGSSE